MTTNAHPTRRRLATVGVLLAAAAAAAIAWLPRSPSPAAAPTADAFCLTPPAEARADADAAQRFDVAVEVPAETPRPGDDVVTHAIARGDVVRIDVRTSRAGGVAVHGLLDTTPLDVGGVTTVAFRAIHGGRFPLHFHGADGSHFEVVVFAVMPRKPPASGAGR